MSDMSPVKARIRSGNLETVDKASGTVVLSHLQAVGSLPAFSALDALTASVSSDQSGGLAITALMSRFTTVGTAGDSATLPTAKAGMILIIKNAAAANSMDVFPASGETINALSADAAYAIASAKAVLFFAAKDAHWDTILTA